MALAASYKESKQCMRSVHTAMTQSVLQLIHYNCQYNYTNVRRGKNINLNIMSGWLAINWIIAPKKNLSHPSRGHHQNLVAQCNWRSLLYTFCWLYISRLIWQINIAEQYDIQLWFVKYLLWGWTLRAAAVKRRFRLLECWRPLGATFLLLLISCT